MAIREDVVASAAKFLQDPSVASSPPESRVAFLKAKNLTEEEIHAALARAGLDGAVPPSPAPSAAYAVAPYASAGGAPPPPFAGSPQYGGAPPPYPPGYGWQQQAPPVPVARRDWRDWFIMATVVGGVSYGLYSMTKRYIAPLVAPPTPDRLAQDKQAVDEQFARAFALVDQLARDTEALKAAETARTERLDRTLGSLEDAVAELRAASKRRDDDTERLRDDVRGLKDALPKALDTQRGVTDSRLRDVNAELAGLRTLLGQRMGSLGAASGSPAAAATPTTTTTTNGYLRPSAPSVASVESDSAAAASSTPAAAAAPAPKAAIPAWQRAMAKPAAAAAPTTNGSGSSSSSTGQAEASGSA